MSLYIFTDTQMDYILHKLSLFTMNEEIRKIMRLLAEGEQIEKEELETATGL